jgi:molecular chaperone DnaK (HSP70)
LERIAVGGHLMLGGDNMDAALAYYALQKSGLPQPNDPTIWSRLVQSARDAKERLLAADAPDTTVISYQGRGSRLVGSTMSIALTREEAVSVLLDGCFPPTGPTEVAERNVRVGLTTLGLPYTSDTAVPRHVCTFLRRHVRAAEAAGATVLDGLPKPDLLLLNGGVFQAPTVVSRLLEVLASWYDGAAPVLLQHTSLDTSVARGAVRYGLSLRGLGTVIGGGTAKAYYVGIEHAGREGARAEGAHAAHAERDARLGVACADEHRADHGGGTAEVAGGADVAHPAEECA